MKFAEQLYIKSKTSEVMYVSPKKYDIFPLKHRCSRVTLQLSALL